MAENENAKAKTPIRQRRTTTRFAAHGGRQIAQLSVESDVRVCVCTRVVNTDIAFKHAECDADLPQVSWFGTDGAGLSGFYCIW